MNLFFAETEPADEKFFLESLPEHQLRFGAIQEAGPDAEGLCIYINSEITADFLRDRPAVKLIAARASGFDHIDVAECARRGIAVCHLPGTNSNTVAEHTFALMLALSRRLIEVREANKHAHFYYGQWRGFDLKEKTLGVVGTGRIGLSVVRIALAFGMKVLGYDPYSKSRMAEIVGLRYVPLDELLHESHVVTLHCPLTPETYHLLNRDAFAQCRRGVIVINTARCAVIDTDALVEALDKGIVAGAGLDVLEEESVMQREAGKIITDHIVARLHSTPEEEQRMRDPEWIKRVERMFRNQRLLGRTNIVFTPHVAFNSVESVAHMNATTVDNIRSYVKGTPINVVPMPAVAEA